MKGRREKRNGKTAGLCLAIGAFFGFLALRAPAEVVCRLRFYKAGMIEPSARAGFLAAAIVLAVAGAIFWFRAGRSRGWRLTAASAAWIGLAMGVVIWAAMGRRMDVVGLAAQGLRLATPIALGAVAGVLSERSGVINIAIEGMMLFAACVGFTAAMYTGSAFVGLVAAVAGGALLALIHAVLSIRYWVDQIISATVINILAVGVTGFIRRGVLLASNLDSPPLLPVWRIPWLSDLPVVGPVLFRHQPLVYIMLAVCLAVHLALFHTRWGLRVRAVGEHPLAADTLGVNVNGLRYVGVVLSGAAAGLGGAWFSLETVGRFDEMMTGGKGFIALAAMIFGKWTPFGGLGGALLFGSADALQIKLQIAGVDLPYQFLGMIPYIVTMVVLAGVIGRAYAPAAVGVPYRRES